MCPTQSETSPLPPNNSRPILSRARGRKRSPPPDTRSCGGEGSGLHKFRAHRGLIQTPTHTPTLKTKELHDVRNHAIHKYSGPNNGDRSPQQYVEEGCLLLRSEEPFPAQE